MTWLLVGKIMVQLWTAGWAVAFGVVAARCNGAAVGIFMALSAAFLVMLIWI